MLKVFKVFSTSLRKAIIWTKDAGIVCILRFWKASFELVIEALKQQSIETL